MQSHSSIFLFDTDRYGNELQIAEASDAIAAIGEVTMDSGDAIDAAKTAYNGLTADQQSRVANAGDLTAAEEQLK